MKKIYAIFMMILLCITCAGCGNTAAKDSSTEKQSSQTSQDTENISESTTDEEDILADDDTAETEAVDEQDSETETEETETEDAETETDQLVVYFSATGHTRAVAEYIANGTGADTFEIVAAEAYSDADLDYSDSDSRSTTEMNDASARPEIADIIENFEQYDTVYIGYPIWWGEAPRILDTFVESYDFTGKTVIPFCTSASSGIGSSDSHLEELAGSGDWKEGQRFGENETSETVMDWVNSL